MRAISLNRAALAAPRPNSLGRDQLIDLLRRLSDELDAFFDDLGVDRESSGNRESTRRS
jgi:hypothetical protein